jgi:hypothetical protein
LSVGDGIKAKIKGIANFGLGEMEAGDKCGSVRDLLEYVGDQPLVEVRGMHVQFLMFKMIITSGGWIHWLLLV